MPNIFAKLNLLHLKGETGTIYARVPKRNPSKKQRSTTPSENVLLRISSSFCLQCKISEKISIHPICEYRYELFLTFIYFNMNIFVIHDFIYFYSKEYTHTHKYRYTLARTKKIIFIIFFLISKLRGFYLLSYIIFAKLFLFTNLLPLYYILIIMYILYKIMWHVRMSVRPLIYSTVEIYECKLLVSLYLDKPCQRVSRVPRWNLCGIDDRFKFLICLFLLSDLVLYSVTQRVFQASETYVIIDLISVL